ncbi:MAG: hypothetical protein H0T75_07300 [Rhizobiales bacterium]|nr:hypothetical protein [Hyphomicrobiales bacterium]MDQ3557683.1 hypothetical protein [Pseudomonadota bacterium]
MTTTTANPATATPAYSPDYAAYLAREAERTRLADELRPANKAALLDALAAAGITLVVVAFDGCGDSGQIESVTAWTGDKPIALPATIVELAAPSWDGPDVECRSEPVEKAIESLAYAFLKQTHGGWENNDGAYGEFSFDVAARTIMLDYNERYVATESYEHAF